MRNPTVVGVDGFDGHEGTRIGFSSVEAALIPFASRLLDVYGENPGIPPIMSPQASLFIGELAVKSVTINDSLEGSLRGCVQNTPARALPAIGG